MKVFCTPAILFVEWLINGRSYERSTKLSLIPVCIGVVITAASDVELNFTGLAIALTNVFINALYTVVRSLSLSLARHLSISVSNMLTLSTQWSNTKQRELECDSFQLLLYQSFWSSLVLLFFVPFFDDIVSLIRFEHRASTVVR